MNLKIILGLIMLNSCGFTSTEKQEWIFNKQLPENAAEIKEFVWAEDFLPDYTYYLKAKLSRAEFEDYIANFDMKMHTDTSQYTDEISWLSTEPVFGDQVQLWWNSASQKDSMFVFQSGQEWIIARYVEGNLYLNAHNH